MLHGCERPFVTTDTRMRVLRSDVVYVHGPSPSAAPLCCAKVADASAKIKRKASCLIGQEANKKGDREQFHPMISE